MSKQELIKAIVKAQGKNANPEYLKTRSMAQLKETYQRWRAINSTTEYEIRRHCNVNFIK